MKILVCSKFYFIVGGVESYLFSLSEMQKNHGHQVIPFSMKHERNFANQYEDYFVSNATMDDFKGLSLTSKLKMAGRIIYSFEAKRKMAELVKKVKPDIAHIHGIYHQISPSILPVLKKNGIPVVMTVQDYKLICPNYKLFINNHICEKCKKTRYFNAVTNKCVKGSYAASLLCCVEMYAHRFSRIYEKNIDVFICPSKWLMQKMIEYGLPAEKMVHIPNFVNVEDYEPLYDSGDYIVYFGRLAVEKGLQTLIKAMKFIDNARLVIVGEGPLKEELEYHCKQNAIGNCDFVGYKSGSELHEMIRNSSFVVLPSEWYENCPLSIYEAFASGKPVIGSNIGGIPELIDDGVNGLLFESQNVEDLVRKIQILMKDSKLIETMGRNARKKVEEECSLDKHYKRVMDIYDKLIS